MNGDGGDDLLFQVGSTLATCGVGYGGVYISNLNGIFANVSCFDFYADKDNVNLIPADVNGDGLNDLIIQQTNAPIVGRLCAGATYHSGALMMSNGDGSFKAADAVCLPFNIDRASTTITIADVNGDDMDDLIIQVGSVTGVGCSANMVAIYISNGDGTFADVQCVAVASDPVDVSLVAVDMNNDGFDDLVLMMVSAYKSTGPCASSSGPGTAAVILNNQGSLSGSIICLPFSGDSAQATLLVNDVNGDGYMDIVLQLASSYTVSGCNGGNAVIYTNDGTSTFTQPQPLCMASNVDPSSVVMFLLDVHGDGCADVLVQVPSNYIESDCSYGSTSSTFIVYTLSNSLWN